MELQNFDFPNACSLLINRYKQDKGISNSSIQQLSEVYGLLESGRDGLEDRMGLYSGIRC